MHFIRKGAGSPPLVFVHGLACSSDDWGAQVVSRAVVRRAKALSADIGAGLYESLANWDVEHIRAALDAVRAPLLAIQSTTVNAEGKRLPLKAGETTPWLDLVRVSIPGARIEVIADAGHFPQVERPEDVNRLLAGFLVESSG